MKYTYIDTGIDWLGKVPSHWKRDKLFRLSDKMGSGGTPRSTNQNYYDGSIPWIQSGDLTDSFVFETEKKITEEALLNSSAKVFSSGTILMAMYGATIGKLGIMQMDAAINQACCAIQPSHKIFPKYLYYLLYNMRAFLISQAYGGGQTNVSQEIIKQRYLFYPSVNEQEAIAEYLDKACARIDKIIEIKKDQLQKIKSTKKSSINSAVRFGIEESYTTQETELEYLPKINSRWKFDRFKDVASLRNEKTDEKSELEDYIELEDMTQGTGRLLNKRNTLEVASKVTKFYKGDVLFGKLRPYLEKFYFSDFDGKCTGEILAFKPERIEGKYLMYLLSSTWFINLCNSMSYGAKMPRVNWNTQLSRIYLPIPSKEEQISIVESLDNISLKTYELTKKIKAQIETLKKYKKSLIHECVTGKKQVKFDIINKTLTEPQEVK